MNASIDRLTWLAEEIGTRAIPWAIWGALLFVGYSGAKLTWALIEPMPTVTVQKLQTVKINNSGQAVASNASQLPQEHLFGEFTKEVVVEEKPVVESAPDTRLSLVLQGVMAAEDAAEGSAVIGRKGGQGQFFRIDEDVFGQAKLAQVFADRVILDRNGNYETLRFEDKPSKGQITSVGSSGSRQSSASSNNKKNNSRNTAVNESVQAMVSSIREEALSNPEQLVTRMGLEASEEGYRVTRRARQLMSLGLRAGDMVVAVNDNPVGNIEQDQLLVDQVIAGGDVKIEIQRGSRRFTIYHTIPNQ